MRKLMAVAGAILVMATALSGAGAQVSGSYTASGSPGNYTLDFTFGNSAGVAGLDLYFICIEPDQLITGFPTAAWSEYPDYTGYLTCWLDYGVDIPDMIQDGEALSGFQTNVASVPASVNYFGYLYEWPSGGPNGNPVYYGTATLGGQAVPEPSSLIALGMGLLAVGGRIVVRRKRSRA